MGIMGGHRQFQGRLLPNIHQRQFSVGMFKQYPNNSLLGCLVSVGHEHKVGLAWPCAVCAWVERCEGPVLQAEPIDRCDVQGSFVGTATDGKRQVQLIAGDELAFQQVDFQWASNVWLCGQWDPTRSK